MSVLDDDIEALKAEVTNNTNAEKAALAAIQGIPNLIQAAVDKAIAAGATPAQLQGITDAIASIKANDDELAAAVVAGTSVATP